jgi:Cu(I)/Ag(I) efflux system membrane fusion protein
MKKFFTILLVALLAAIAGWMLRGNYPASGIRHPASDTTSGKKLLYYQSSMHPWIKSDKPGKCTICGMDLVAVYEGDRGFEAGPGLVTLGSNTVQAIHVQTAEVTRRPLSRTLRFAGQIDDDDTKHRFISAYVDGRIDQLFFTYVGAEIREGQPLAMLYSPMLMADVRNYLALRDPSGKAAPDEATQNLVTAARMRLRQLGLSNDQINRLPATVGQESLNIEVLAPMSGTVVAKEVYEGQYVKEGDRLFELADFNVMWLKFQAYEHDLTWLRPGLKVQVTTPSVSGKTFAGEISFIDPNFDEKTRSTKVIVELPNPLVGSGEKKRRELAHRIFAEAAVTAEIPEVLAVPRQAVLNPGGTAVVYVEKGAGVYEQRRVQLGRSGDDAVEILGGLAAGERVVSTGNLLIDSQAQLDQSVTDMSGEPVPKIPDAKQAAMSAAQQEVLGRLFAAAGALSDALASDNVGKFNEQAMLLHSLAPEAARVFKGAGDREAVAEAVNRTSHWPEPADLPSARARFHPFMNAVLALASSARLAGAAPATLKVYECPMTKTAFPGAPASARWLQLDGPKRNPYFGAAMLDCGTEVKP